MTSPFPTSSPAFPDSLMTALLAGVRWLFLLSLSHHNLPCVVTLSCPDSTCIPTCGALHSASLPVLMHILFIKGFIYLFLGRDKREWNNDVRCAREALISCLFSLSPPPQDRFGGILFLSPYLLLPGYCIPVYTLRMPSLYVQRIGVLSPKNRPTGHHHSLRTHGARGGSTSAVPSIFRFF